MVWHDGISLAKPADLDEAFSMLKTLSNDWHEVITSVCLTTNKSQQTVNQCTRVKFKELSHWEMDHYIRNYNPFDKAGGYGIQDWIGLIGIEEIQWILYQCGRPADPIGLQNVNGHGGLGYFE